MTLREQKSRFVCKKLGICWHEPDGAVQDKDTYLTSYHCYLCQQWYDSNPDFFNRDRIRLLEILMQRVDWVDFLNSLSGFSVSQ